MFPPGFDEWSPTDRASFLKYHPAMAIAHEVDDMIGGRTPPLSPREIAFVVPFLSQAAQAATPLPGVLWSRFFRFLAKVLHPAPVRIGSILAAMFIPYILYINGNALSAFLIDHGLFAVIDWLRDVF